MGFLPSLYSVISIYKISAESAKGKKLKDQKYQEKELNIMHMASIAISASLQIVCGSGSNHVSKKQHPPARPACALGTKEANHVVSLNVEAQTGLKLAEQENAASHSFLNFIQKLLQKKIQYCLRPPSTIVPWWAWIRRSHLPEAELLNGRAAMVGFFMAYFVDALTGVGVVGQTGNFIYKAGLLATVIGVILFRRADDFDNLKKLADEATFYDKQWQASWQEENQSSTSGSPEKNGNKS